MNNFEIVEDHPDEGRSILYYVLKTPIGIKNRDFLQERKIKHDFPKPGNITFYFKSVKHDKKPETSSNIRADTIISGYIIEECRSGTKMTMLS